MLFRRITTLRTGEPEVQIFSPAIYFQADTRFPSPDEIFATRKNAPVLAS
jgi:hypothetical protein